MATAPVRQVGSSKPRLCWRHRLDLSLAAFGGLIDLTGTAYPRWGRRIMTESRACSGCAWPSAVSIEAER